MTNLKTVSMGVLDRQLTNKEAWTTFWACFLYGFTTSFMCFKVSSPLLAIAEEFSIAEGDIGMVMTTFAIAALVLAYPGTWFMRNVGVKFTVIVTALFSLAGTVLGCVATTYEIFMFSRVLEGIGYGMFAAMGANICTRIFPTSKLGLVMGTWSLWMPVGSTFAFVASPLIFEALGWRAIWVFCAILEIVSIAAVLFLMKMPAKSEADLVEGDPAKERRKTKNFFFAAIMVQVAFTAWCFLYLVNINSLYPAYLQQIKGLSVMDSSMLPTILAVITIVFGVFAGILADKTRQRKWMLVIAYIAVAINFAFFVFTEDPANMASPWIAMVIMGLCGLHAHVYPLHRPRALPRPGQDRLRPRNDGVRHGGCAVRRRDCQPVRHDIGMGDARPCRLHAHRACGGGHHPRVRQIRETGAARASRV